MFAFCGESTQTDIMSLPVLSVAAMRTWEQASWAAGRREEEVIEQVGEQLARRAAELTRSRQRILLLAGKGHNGDDVRAALRFLPARSVTRFDVRDPAADLDPLKALLRPRPALVLDGLFGIGLNRDLSGPWRTLIETINEAQLRVLSVDVPSGLNADTGNSYGAVVRAEETLTIGAPKAGLLTGKAAPWVGRLSVAACVGLIPWEEVDWTRPFDTWWNEALDYFQFPASRPAWVHKGCFGHLVLVAGSRGYHGAAVLAARAAARARPGWITVATSEQTYLPVAAQLASPMVSAWDLVKDRWPDRMSALVAGPGLAGSDVPDWLRERLRDAWRNLEVPMLVDASALDWLPQGRGPSTALRVITPHLGEAARLLGIPATEVQADRAAALQALSGRYGDCWVVLKGQHTLIGRNAGGKRTYNSTGNPGLAQGGTGDVLAGYVGGLIAQPELARTPEVTLTFGTWEHGATADNLEMDCPNWTSEDLATRIGSSRCS